MAHFLELKIGDEFMYNGDRFRKIAATCTETTNAVSLDGSRRVYFIRGAEVEPLTHPHTQEGQ